MKLKAMALRALPLAAMVGQASATTISIPTLDINMTAAVQPILDLIQAIGPTPFYLIALVLGVVILSVISGAGNFVVKLFDRILKKI
jgi:hypothetical protein